MASLLFKIISLLAVGVGAWYLCCSPNPDKPPTLDPNEWWGPNELKGKVDESIRSFKIKFDEQIVKDLIYRLKSHRPFTPPLEGIDFEYGFNTKELENWVKYWADEYPFSQREQFLNQYPQYKTNIQGLDIHFIRVKPSKVPPGVKVLPLLIVHGWPGSVREFYEAIPLLTRSTPDYDFVFELIIPSIPGYGFSDPAVRPGLAIPQVAVIFRNLMRRIGHKQYYVQGGDWGSGITKAIAILYPEDVLGYHTNFANVQGSCSTIWTLIGSVFPSLVVDSQLADRMYPLAATFNYILGESGYFHLQATKPDTVGVGLTDSPAGLLAYITEKFAVWTRKDNKFKADGGLTRFTKDQIIDNLMLYWVSNSITTSMRFYAENYSKKIMELDVLKYKVEVPSWAIQAKHEILYQPPNILRLKFTNLINTTVLEEGGHFFALEMPITFSQDVFRAVKAFTEWHKGSRKEEL